MASLNYSALPMTMSDHRQKASQQLPKLDDAWVMDTLNTIFHGQKILMDKYHYIEFENGAVVVSPDMWGAVDDRYVQMRLKDLLFRLVVEIGEAAEELQNKPWRQTDTPVDVKAFHKEVSDMLHFFVEFCITAGIEADKLFELYFEKHAINQERQRSGY